MAKIVGILKHASVPTLTASGNKSEARAVDPQDTKVEVLVDGKPETRSVLETVRKFCKALAEKKAKEEEAADHAIVLRTFVGELRTSNAVQGDYQKTYRVVGESADKVQYMADVSQADAWGALKGVDMKALRKKTGAAVFDAVVEEDESISIKPEILKNKVLRKEFSAALTAAFGIEGVKKYFQREVTWGVKEGTDKAQYTLPADQKVVLTEGFKQSADSVKDASQKG
jgi:hypothetical protein